MSKNIRTLSLILVFLTGIVTMQICCAEGEVTFGDDPAVQTKASESKDTKSEEATTDKAETDEEDKDDAVDEKENAADKEPEEKKPADEKEAEKNSEEKAEETFELDGALIEPFSHIAEQAKLSMEKQKKLVLLQSHMDKTIAQFDKKNAMKIEAYQRKIDKADEVKEQKKYQKRIDQIEAGKLRIQQGYEMKALKLLDTEEMERRNFTILWSTISSDMMMLNVSEEQSKKAEEICHALATRLKRKPLTEKNQERFRFDAAKKVMKEALNKEQQKEYKRVLTDRIQMLRGRNGKR